LLAYLEAGEERISGEHRRAVDAVRLGTIFAYDRRQWQRWLAAWRIRPGAIAGSTGRGLVGSELEEVIGAMAVTNPDIVRVRLGKTMAGGVA
jgi:hypothetical protein